MTSHKPKGKKNISTTPLPEKSAARRASGTGKQVKNASENPQRRSNDGNLSNIWRNLSQTELYEETHRPEPQIAIGAANAEKFHENSAAYVWNNERASALPHIFKCEGKTALGVAASGDQPYVCFEYGLRSYLAFDISQVSCFWNELKTASILNLSRKEFIDFTLGHDVRESFSLPPVEEKDMVARTISIYDMLRKNLTAYASKFFDELISKARDRNCIRSILGRQPYFRDCSLDISEVPYLKNETEYARLQKNLCKADYKLVWQELTPVLKLTPDEKFDMIFISNILDRWEKFGSYNDILKLLGQRLKREEGSLIIGSYQCGDRVTDNINNSLDGTGLELIKYCSRIADVSGADTYYALRHR